jgi:hypothetical protein
MAFGQGQLIGAAGQYYVAYGLSKRNIIASLTVGNAPSVDILAASDDGRRSLCLQVKTSRGAYRNCRYDHSGYEWDVGSSVIGRHSESLWYALVDLQENGDEWKPRVFFVPSRWVAEFVKPDFSRKLYYLASVTENLEEIEALTSERWDLVTDYLAGNQKAIDWANTWPKEKLIQWGD